jgi:hypothetical protein
VKGAVEAARREEILRALLKLMRGDPVVDDLTDILALAKEKVAAFCAAFAHEKAFIHYFTRQWEDKIGEIASASWQHVHVDCANEQVNDLMV